MFGFLNLNKKLTERLYQQNLDFAVKNTTFSLLEKLYQTSILTLTPEEMAREITNIIRKDLDVELAGIYIFEKPQDRLAPLAFAKSDELLEHLTKLEFLFETTKIANVSAHDFFKKVIYAKEDTIANNFHEVFKDFINQGDLEIIQANSNIKNLLVYPLIKGQEVFGVLLLGINRDYDNIGIFERSSIRSIINAIALLLDKAYLYKNLLVSYEIEKKGREQIQQAYEIEKKSKQELQKLDQDKNDFMLITQHHLRTPLTSMAWRVQLIESGFFGKVPKKLQDVIHKFGISNKVLIKIVNEFLDLSQFEMGQKVISLSKEVNVQTLVMEIVKELAPQAEAKNIFLQMLPVETKLPLIEADVVKLPTAILSVIDDAIKFTEKGGVKVGLALKDSKIQIMIQDTGIGIAKEDLPALFNNRFSRSEGARAGNVTGRGVGLYLADKVIQAHNGKIWADSEGKGRGATFYIQLPVAQKTGS